MKSSRTLVLGLDSFDFDLAKRLASRGLLPWFGAQQQQGSFVATRGPVLQGSEWVNATCGVSPAHHGYLHSTQLRLGTYEQVVVDGRIVRADPFYVPLARAGVRTVVVDLPADRPHPQANLVQIVDWGQEFNLWHYSATPRAIKRLVRSSCGSHPLTHHVTTIPDETNLLALRDKLLHGTQLKGKLIRELMSHDPQWQVLFAVFCEVHKGAHFFWQFHDSSHPNYGGADHPLAGALVELYQALDRECARICAAAGDAVNLLVVSDRGMDANFRGDHLVVPVLERLGLCTAARGTPVRATTQTTGGAAQGAWQPEPKSLGAQIKRRTPVWLRGHLRKLAGHERINWRKTKVFQIAEVGTSYLRVNLIGREPLGAVAPGTEYEALLDALERQFKALTNPATGRSPVAEIVFPQRAFPGPLNAELPDMGIVWGHDAPVDALESPGIGRIEGIACEQRSGNHTPAGGMLVVGPGFATGIERAGDLRELAPTLLALHGVGVPAQYQFGPMPERRR